MDRTEAMICQRFYLPDIRDDVRKEVTNCDTCQHTKWSKIKYGKLPDKEVEEITWKKLFLYLIGCHGIRINGKKSI